jgi:hypothetical protein
MGAKFNKENAKLFSLFLQTRKALRESRGITLLCF